MADDQPPAPRKVVKRVVKKPAPAARPTVRYGRPVAPEEVPAPTAPRAESKPKSTKKTRRPAPVDDLVVDEPTETTVGTTVTVVEEREPEVEEREPEVVAPPRVRRSLDVAGAVRRARAGAGSSAGAIGSGVGRAAGGTGRVLASGIGAVRRTRLPTIDPVPASLVTGLLVGLLAVLLGRAALEMFSALRGVASGGGTWGSLTFVVVTFVAFVVGELLLGGFGAAQPRITSFLGVFITVIVILGLFLEESDTGAAVYLVPALAATAFTVAHWLMVAAEQGADDT